MPFFLSTIQMYSPKFYGKETDKTNSRMEQEFLMRIANEINRQIRCGVTMSVQMSWGVSKRIATIYKK